MRTRSLPAAIAAGSLLLTPGLTANGAGTAEPPKQPTKAWITLITGDRLLVRSLPGQPEQVTFVPTKGSSATAAVISRHRGHTFAIPTNVQSEVVKGRLDRSLFDVTTLLAERYDETLPVIVSYAGSLATARVRAAQDKPAGAQRTRLLPSIGARSVAITKASEFWKSALEPGVAKISLDRRVKAVLDQSVPQIGAPAAWQRGITGRGVKVAVLDTGVDTNHPDLAGKVAESVDFSGSPDAGDHFGHGTHVASTIAGSGAASDGKYRGVAPDATLLNGKVLDDFGSGFESGIIAGMEWAVAQGADVVSMSLGGGPTDGTDPMAQAVNRLSQQTGALFVIAAGNSGPAPETVGTPGSADAALTVAAVDKQDGTAQFSSRGPRVGDRSLKPEIAGPGVGIVAARAAGTSMGDPVGEHYTTASGTSMATPHVAGAAALLAQAKPDWTGDQLKRGLIATADPGPGDGVHGIGSGRVDADQATGTALGVDTGKIEFGFVKWPHPDPAPVTRTVTYQNAGTTPVTLDLTARMDSGDSAAPPAFSTRQVVVPAGGSAGVDVTATFGQSVGDHTGRIIATPSTGGDPLVIPFGWYLEPELYDVAISAVNPNGSTPEADVVLDRVDGGFMPDLGMFGVPLVDGKATVRIPPGVYTASAALIQAATDKTVDTLALVAKPEITISKESTTILLDGRRTTPVSIRPKDQPGLRSRESGIDIDRTDVNGDRAAATGVSAVGDQYRFLASPTDAVRLGSVSFTADSRLEVPAYRARELGRGTIPVSDYEFGTRFTGTKRLTVVDAGKAEPGDLEQVRGKLAVVQRTSEEFGEQVLAAERAGAAAVLMYNPERAGLDRAFLYPFGATIPVVATTRVAAAGLLERVRGSRVTVELTGVAFSPSAYDMIHTWKGRIPADATVSFAPERFARIDETFGTHSDGPGVVMSELRIGFSEEGGSHGSAFAYTFTGPVRRTAYVLGGPALWNQLVVENQGGGEGLADWEGTQRSYRGGERLRERWFTPVATSGLPGPGAHFAGASTGNGLMFLELAPFVHGSTQYEETVLNPFPTGSTTFELQRNGTTIGRSDTPGGIFQVPPEPADYRITLDAQRDLPWWRYSTRVRSTWDFRTVGGQQHEALPMVLADVEVPQADLFNKVKTGEPTTIRLGLRQYAGSASRFTSAKLEISYDGSTWTPLSLTPAGTAGYTATVTHPVAHAGGAVHLRIEAQDDRGGRLSQEVTRAYGLSR